MMWCGLVCNGPCYDVDSAPWQACMAAHHDLNLMPTLAPPLAPHLPSFPHQAYYERRHTPQYVEDFKTEVQKLCLPGQRFHFSTYRCVRFQFSTPPTGCQWQKTRPWQRPSPPRCVPPCCPLPTRRPFLSLPHPPAPPLCMPARLSVAEDAALATAFSASLRAAVLPTASAAGNASAGGHVQLYLDSHVLQHQLQSLGDDSLQRLKRTRGERAQLDVPVFFFAIASDPILIDQSLLAKSLPDMVLSVQLPHRHWPTGVACNGKEMHADLRWV
ncbi:unnamed protein product [Closterium sp. NIES-53]